MCVFFLKFFLKIFILLLQNEQARVPSRRFYMYTTGSHRMKKKCECSICSMFVCMCNCQEHFRFYIMVPVERTTRSVMYAAPMRLSYNVNTSYCVVFGWLFLSVSLFKHTLRWEVGVYKPGSGRLESDR